MDAGMDGTKESASTLSLRVQEIVKRQGLNCLQKPKLKSGTRVTKSKLP